MKKIEAIIFNMDGIMFNTIQLWIDSVLLTNHIYGYKIPIDLLINSIGKSKLEIEKVLKANMPPKFNAKKYLKRNSKYIKKYIKKNSLIPKDGLLELIAYAKNNNIKLAIASSSNLKTIKKRLKKAKIPSKNFDVIITDAMVNKSKPNPDIYLECCTKLNVKTKNTYVLENTDYGLDAAKRAKTIPILIPDFKTLDKKTLNKAYKVLNNLSEVITLLKNQN